MEKTIFSRDQAVLLRELRRARKAAKVSQVVLAERLGTTQRWVSVSERGERRLDYLELRLICKALQLPFVRFVETVESKIAEVEEE